MLHNYRFKQMYIKILNADRIPRQKSPRNQALSSSPGSASYPPLQAVVVPIPSPWEALVHSQVKALQQPCELGLLVSAWEGAPLCVCGLGRSGGFFFNPVSHPNWRLREGDPPLVDDCELSISHKLVGHIEILLQIFLCMGVYVC